MDGLQLALRWPYALSVGWGATTVVPLKFGWRSRLRTISGRHVRR
jgi:hypothetical protein